jgi:hypothetical protein
MAVLKFEPNIPQTLAFTYAKGKESPSQQYTNFDGSPVMQWFRKTKAGDSVYLSPYVEQELIAMDYRAGEPVVICKRVQGKSTKWEVHRPDHIDNAASQQREAQRNTQSSAARPVDVAPPMRSNPPVNGASVGTAATVMQNCLKTAVDMALWTVQYAKSKDMLLTPEFAAIKEIANTLFIQHSKAGNIRAMHDNQEHLAHVTRNGDADFSREGSQQAADAVAKRKLAEMRDPADQGNWDPGPPPEWLKDEDLSFLGEAPVA